MTQPAPKLAAASEKETKKPSAASSALREAVAPLTQAASALPRAMTEMTALCHSGTEAAAECFNVVSDTAKNAGAEVTQAFTGYAEFSKEALACRTINDVMTLQNRVVQHSIEHGFMGGKFLMMGFDCCTALLKPIQGHIAQTTERFGKVASQAAKKEQL